MNIRNRLLYLLLPPLLAFVALSTTFFYYQWRREILATFRARLEAVVATAAKGITDQEVAWLIQQANHSESKQHPLFEPLQKQLRAIAQAAVVDSLFIVSVEAVKPGEPVLLNQPVSEANPVYEGTHRALAHRQVYWIDVTLSKQSERPIASYDFSESEEHLIYYTRQPMVTPTYTARYGGERLISAYAPILDSKGEVVALIGADVSMASVDEKLQRALFSLIGSALATIVLLSFSVFFAANRISRPVQQLKNTALSIAAGDYDTAVTVTEPLEIAELANTLNTMSACLKENIERLRQNATTRERLLGEYECALLLQKRMFTESAKAFHHPHMRVYSFHSEGAAQPHGVYLAYPAPYENKVELSFSESAEMGFDGLYHLLQGQGRDIQQVQLTFQWPERQGQYTQQGDFCLGLWSQGHCIALDSASGTFSWQEGDMLFLASQVWRELFTQPAALQAWLQRFVVPFSRDDTDLFASLADKELGFLCDRCHLERDFFLLCLQLT